MTLSERMPGDASDRPYVTIAVLALFVFAGLMIVVAALTSGQGGAPGDQSAAGAPTVTNGTAEADPAEAPANETTGTASATARESTSTPEPVSEERSPTATATASATPTGSSTPTAEPTSDSTTSGSSSGGNGAAPAPSDDTEEPTSTPTATDTATEAGTATETETGTETATTTQPATASPTPTSTAEPAPTPSPTTTPTDTTTTTPTATAEPAPTPDSYQVTVEGVVTGDTINVRYENGSTERVRLLGVDVPSADGENDPDDYEGIPDTEGARECLRSVGEEADQYAHDRLLSRTVEIRTDAAADRRDSQGRLLVYLNVDGDDFSAHMLEEGRARVVDTTFSRSGAYSDAESRAREENIGVWGCSRYGTPTPDNSG